MAGGLFGVIEVKASARGRRGRVAARQRRARRWCGPVEGDADGGWAGAGDPEWGLHRDAVAARDHGGLTRERRAIALKDDDVGVQLQRRRAGDQQLESIAGRERGRFPGDRAVALAHELDGDVAALIATSARLTDPRLVVRLQPSPTMTSANAAAAAAATTKAWRRPRRKGRPRWDGGTAGSGADVAPLAATAGSGGSSRPASAAIWSATARQRAQVER